MLMLSFSFWSFLSERHHFLLNVKLGYLVFCDQCKCKHNKLSKKESWFFFTCSAYLNNRNYRGNFLEILALSPNLRVKFSSLVSILRLDKSVLDINNFDFKMSPLKQGLDINSYFIWYWLSVFFKKNSVFKVLQHFMLLVFNLFYIPYNKIFI